MLDNKAFLRIIGQSFEKFLLSGTSRSPEKLKPLHGAIARDLAERLGGDYKIYSQGYGSGKEATIQGRYVDKKVDITIEKWNRVVGGIGVKFVMQNYSQNSNNYFENMLGETANIRSALYPYFQVFIILDKLPYYNDKKIIKKWEAFTDQNVEKYVTMANDNVDRFFHTPNRTLIYVVHIPENDSLATLDEYLSYYKNLDFEITLSPHRCADFGKAVVLNYYENFMQRVYHTIKAEE